MAKPDKYWYDQGYQIGSYYDGDPDDAPDPLSGEFAGQSMPEIFGSWDEATEENQDAYESGYWAAIYGNPGTIPLHESLATLAQWTEYEAAVVEVAADELPPGDVKDSAHDQADAMHEAAESLQDAADDAAETAAEVFVETGVPSVDQSAEVVAGNPLPLNERSGAYSYAIIQQNADFNNPSHDADMRARLFDEWYEAGYQSGDTIPKKWEEYVTLLGNPIVEDISDTTEDIVTEVIPDTVEESIAESAAKDVAPEPDNWLFRKRFGRR